MVPYLIGAGIAYLLLKQKRSTSKKKVFISFAIEDEKYRDYLVEQAREKNSPFDFMDMSVKSPWKEDEWKRKCEAKISKCDGLIILLSNKTWHASGARWEVKCANKLNIPVRGMHIKKNKKSSVPPEVGNHNTFVWSWKNLERFINNLP